LRTPGGMSTSKTPNRRADAWEWRRQRAWELHEQGWWQTDIAGALGVSNAAVCQWLKRRREGGVEALRTRPRPGPTPRHTAEQWAQIPALLAGGAEAYGFRGDVWTASRIAVVIWRTFGVRYHRDHISRRLRQLGWSRQQPVQRATQRDEAARRGGDWAVVRRALAGPQKKADDEGRTILWVDEAGCSLLPLAVRTWAPRAQTPVLRVKLTREPLAAISGIPVEGRLFRQMQGDAYDSAGVVGFLRVLLRTIRGQLLLIGEGSPLHQGQPIKDFLKRGAAKRLHLERLPGYAPDLNPDEGIWSSLQRVELKNRCCRDLAEVRLERRRAAARLRHKRDLIRSCSAHCGYSV